MATVYKRKTGGNWIAKYKSYNREKGKWLWTSQSTGTADKSQAQAIAYELEKTAKATEAGGLSKRDIEETVKRLFSMAGHDVHIGCPTIAEHLQEVLKSKMARGLAPASIKAIITRHNRFLSRFDNDIRLDMLTTNHLQKYYDELCQEMLPSTAYYYIAEIGSCYALAIKKGYLYFNPAAAVEKKRNKTAPSRTIINAGEVWRVIMAQARAGSYEWLALTLLGWHTGARLSDCLAYDASQVKKVNWLAGFNYLWSFEEKKKRGRGRVLSLPLPAHVVKLCNEHLHQLQGRWLPGISAEFIEWLEIAGVDVKRQQFKTRRRACKSFHSFRHSMQTRLAAANVSDSIRMMVTGHASLAVARNYTHNDVEAVAGALRSI